MAEKLLEIKNLNISYGEEDVLKNISVSLSEGETICIVGESGSGKTTLLRAICAMDNVHVTSGSVSFRGQNIFEIDKKTQRRLLGHDIGMILQNPAGSFNPIRRFDLQFKETFRAHNLPYDEDRICDMFEKVGLTDGKKILKSRPYEMSGGMNQRIAIAITMLLSPGLLLCDEVTSALDVTSANAIVRTLREYRREQNVGILMVTHHLGIAQEMADHIGIMKTGRIIEYGSCEEIFKFPQEEYTAQLIKDVPKLLGKNNE